VLQLHVSCTDEIHREGVTNFANGPGHPERGPLGQESDDYKRGHLESKRAFIHSSKNIVFSP